MSRIIVRAALLAAAAGVVAGLAGCAGRGPADVDGARIAAADREPGNWMSHGRTYDEQRFSPLDKINAANVKDLGLAWYADLDTNRGQEATPIVVDGALYVSTAWSMVKAYDAATGKLLWAYDPKVQRDVIVNGCCDAVNRGVAVWKGKVYVGVLDGRLVALDAATGKEAWSVVTVDQNKPYTITGAPRVVKDKVIIGNGGAEFGVRGYVTAYDAATGKQVWRFYTVPGDPAQGFESKAMELAAQTWTGEWWTLGGGGTVWDSIVYDPALDLLYIGVGNGAPWNQAYRSPGGGDNLFLSSIVALRPDTGEYVWHFQETPGETWDFTATQQIILADLSIDGKPRKVAMQAPKNGFFYVIDRETGKFISARPYAPMNWATGVDPVTGRPIEVPEARFYKTGKLWMQTPGAAGAHNWQPMAFNPQTGLVYIPEQELTFPYLHEADWKPAARGFNNALDGVPTVMPADPKIRRAALDAEKGNLIAWDPVAQKEVWRVVHYGPWNGGVLTTAGNLVLQGSTTGQFNAYRADNGAPLWSSEAQTAVMGGPMSYTVKGEQYIAVMAGWGGVFPMPPGVLALKTGKEYNRSRLLVYKLGGRAQLPPLVEPPVQELNPPPATARPERVEQGKALYTRYCAACHGDAAVSGHLVADLRYSVYLANDDWFEVVLNGKLGSLGMAGFGVAINRDQAAAIRDYVIQRAHEDKALPYMVAPPAAANAPPAAR
ncbi:MAG: PQQ-dependent dehydrogenase, methanol/ethanol family [Gammaproteobacteria bacterium]|nr:PQQ-dependent dehydrogenase, methanol/ethanol family [Gammaproteobacteria bacterium]